ncbi:MAG: insulinase family protein [Usitatibacter sp.]
MRRLFAAAALLVSCLWATAGAAPDLADLPPRVQAPTDTATFRRFTLDNGLRVLLVSDPKFNKSGASLVVNTGQIDDPGDTEGTAHFLEHMLFLGTEKYPDVSEYGNFIRSNGGYQNAYTATDHTNFQFEVRHAAFPDALDRFAQFFIAPKFNPDFTDREKNAVHNEAIRHVQNDFRRLLNVMRELYTPGSGESKFSTGNKDTLVNATPAAVRAFYESHYSADHMALAIAGKASLDELEKLARADFSAIPRRPIPPVKREATFLPHKAALRMAFVEPVKEVHQLTMEFPIGPTRPDFASKPDLLVDALLSYPGPGGITELLKNQGLITKLGSFVYERTGDYGSIFIQANLTPEGEKQYSRVLAEIFAYLDFLRAAPFPAAFYADRARIAALHETYSDRGEGASLATKLSNQALFYPLEVAERATDVWGKPDEGAYRRLLGALTPDNMLAALMAKGVPTDKKERIYATAYSYREDAGAGYQALAHPSKVASFALPGANRFMPAAAPLVPERPVALISEPGVQLYYAQDTEFLRPQTTLIFRFVPTRDIATVPSAALLRLYTRALDDFLEPAIGDARLAGIEISIEASLEGFKMSITGYGDSPVRFASYVASQLRTFTLPQARFDATKEATMRGLKSYGQTEAYSLARDRRDAIAREYYFLPDQLVAATDKATWSDVQGFARKFFARGKLEAIVHGHLSAEDAVKVTRDVAKRIGAAPAPANALLRRRHMDIAAAENVIDTGEIAGVNSAFVTDYVLPDDSAATRAAALVAGNFMSEPFFTELRTKQQLGYIVGSASSASLRQRYFTFVVQSSGYAPDDLRKRAETFIATLPAALAATTDEQWKTLVAGARSKLEEKPKSIPAKAELFFDNAYDYGAEWTRREETLAALDTLTREKAVALLTDAFAPETSRRRTVLLYTQAHPMTAEVKPSFTERDPWKAKRKYQ